MATDRYSSELKLTITETELSDDGLEQRVVAEDDYGLLRLEFINQANAFVGWQGRKGQALILEGFHFVGFSHGEDGFEG